MINELPNTIHLKTPSHESICPSFDQNIRNSIRRLKVCGCVSCSAFLFGLCVDPFSPSSLQLGRTRCTCLLSDKSDGTEYRCQPEGCRFADGSGSFLSLYCARCAEQSTCTRLGSAASRPTPPLYVLRISEKSSDSLKLPSKLGVQIHEMVRRRDLPSD